MKKQELYQLFLENHNNSLENLNKSLKNQIEYQIVNHQRIDNLNDLKAELCGGTSTPELEIRFDAGHQPWVSHSARIGRLGLINHLYSEELQDEKLSLEESFKLYKEGVGLVSACNESIDKVEKEIKVIEDESAKDGQ